MTTPDRVHLLAHANPLGPDAVRFGFANVDEYLAFARQHLPAGLRLTYTPEIMHAVEAPWHGGRQDDDARVRDLNAALADPQTLALVALSGGAYFARLLPRLDFEPLAARRAPFWALGFSEMTTLLGHVSTYGCGRALYWLCPNWLGARLRPADQARAALAEFWRCLPGVLGRPAVAARDPSGAAEDRLAFGPLRGRLVRGTVRCARVRLVGGCLAVLAAALTGPLARRLRPRGKWLVLEDIKESPYRIDRHLAALQLAGWFEQIGGLVLGDFHMLHEDTQPAVLELLRYHLPPGWERPVITTRSFGHIWPMVPVPLNRALPVHLRGADVLIG